MNPYEAPQTIDQPPQKPRRRNWLWPDFSRRPATSQGGGQWYVFVAVLVFSSFVRSACTPHSASKPRPAFVPSSTTNQQQQLSPEVEKLLQKLREDRNRTTPRPLSETHGQP